MTHTQCCLIKHLYCTIAQVKSMDIERYLRPELSLVLKVKVAPSCLTLCDPIDYTVHGILQARMLEWVAFPFSRVSSQPRDRTQVSHITGRFFSSWATGKSSVLSGDVSSIICAAGDHISTHPTQVLLMVFAPWNLWWAWAISLSFCHLSPPWNLSTFCICIPVFSKEDYIKLRISTGCWMRNKRWYSFCTQIHQSHANTEVLWQPFKNNKRAFISVKVRWKFQDPW